jgi:tetratricopeptide (TPR) repeat protein
MNVMKRMFFAYCLLSIEAASQPTSINITATEDSIIVNDSIGFSNVNIAAMNLSYGIEAALDERHQDAIGYFDAALLFDIENPEIWYNRGLACYYLDDLEMALLDFTQALVLRPADTTTLSQRGITHARLGDTARAFADLNELLRINPNSALGHYNKAIVYLQVDRPVQACALLRKAEALGYGQAASVFSRFCP